MADKKELKAKVPFGLQLQFSFLINWFFRKIKNELGGNLSFLPCGGAMLKKKFQNFCSHWFTRDCRVWTYRNYCYSYCTSSENYVYGSVGKALPGVEIKIGADDEILVKYQGVMKGYYKTKKKQLKFSRKMDISERVMLVE